MSEHFLTVNGIQKKKGMIKTYSFTTDDDEAKPGTDSPLISNHDESLPQVSPTNENVSSESDESRSNATLQNRKSLRQKESTVEETSKYTFIYIFIFYSEKL